MATVRVASFEAAAQGGSATVEKADAGVPLPTHTRFVSHFGAATGRPDLQAAARVVAGGRALGSADGFRIIYSLAQTQTNLTPEQVAEIASAYLGNSSIYSIEGVVVRGENLYKVTFSSGDILYLNMTGQVVGSEAAPPAFVQVARRGSQGGGGGEHEEDHDD